MDLETRLRSELERTGGDADVSPAPAIDELADVAKKRHQRNRLLGGGASVVLVAAVGLGILSNSSPETSLEVASGGADDVSEVSDAAVAPEEDTLDGAAEVTTEEGIAAGDDPVAQDSAPESATNEEVVEAPVDRLDGVRRSLQIDRSAVEIEMRSSAVALAAGSGVLVVSDDDGGYGGLATRFGSQTSAIGLTSKDGLDWEEVELNGVPEGATASQLIQEGDTFVALFESFDAAVGRQTFVGTSTDLATWDVSAPLAGEPFATDLAVGSAGVIVLGDNSTPDVWVGPIGGPYERTARLAAVSVNGVTTVGDEFLVAGRSSEGATLFRSVDGIDWSGAALNSPNIPGSAPTVSVDEGIIILSNVDTGGTTSLISADGGETWDQLDTGSDSVVINSSTLGFLGFSDRGAAVSIADDESFVSAEIDVEAPDRLSLVAAGDGEVVLIQATEEGANWIVASR